MNINYEDLHRLVSDLRYILQTGGNPFIGGGSFADRFNKLTDTMKTLLVFILLVIVFVILWRFLFRGYPRMLFDIATLSFYRKEDVDRFLENRNFFFNHYKQLLRTDWGTFDPFRAVSSIYNYPNSSLQMAALRVERLLALHYGKLRYDERLREMFREFYLFDRHINTEPNRRKVVYSWIEYTARTGMKPPMQNSPEAAAAGKYRPTPKVVQTPTIIEYTDFYETMLEYKKKRGMLTEKDFIVPYDNQRKKNDEELVTELYVKDKIAAESATTMTIGDRDALLQTCLSENKRSIDVCYNLDSMKFLKIKELLASEQSGSTVTYEFKRVRQMNEALRALALECKLIVDRVRELPYAMYLTIPDAIETVARFKVDFDSRKDLVYNGRIYMDTVKFKDINEFSWYMFEVLPYVQHSAVNFDTFFSEYNQLVLNVSPDVLPQLHAALLRYMNLPYSKRILAESKISLSHPALKPILTPKFYSFVNKHPIFMRVMLNPMIFNETIMKIVDVTQRKQAMMQQRKDIYEMTLKAYAVLMRPRYSNPETVSTQENELVENLMKNGESFQMLLNAINIMDLYINDYRTDLTKLYEEHYISNQQFFQALWKPYFQEIWSHRVMEKYKRTFDWQSGILVSWSRFRNNVWGYGMQGSTKSGLGKILYGLQDQIMAMFKRKPTVNNIPEASVDTSMPPDDDPGSFAG